MHTSIGVLGAVTVGAATAMPGSVAAAHTRPLAGVVRLEHPSGWFDVIARAGHAAVVSTARPLMDGRVFPGPRSGNPDE